MITGVAGFTAFLMMGMDQARRKHFGSGTAIGTKKTAGGLGAKPPEAP